MHLLNSDFSSAIYIMHFFLQYLSLGKQNYASLFTSVEALFVSTNHCFFFIDLSFAMMRQSK